MTDFQPMTIRLTGSMQKETAMQVIRNLVPDAKEPLQLRIEKAKSKRSLDQNAISHSWYEQIAYELKEDDALGWKCHCKLHFGVPILRAEDAEFREVYDNAIKPMTYERKLIAMKYWPVTSIMSKNQLSRYLETMQSEFASRGVRLEFPVEEVG